MAFVQDVPDTLDANSLRNLVEGFGYTTKQLNSEKGKEKWEVELKSETLNVPVAFEISASGNYIWLTVNLGDLPQKSEFSAKAGDLLRQNGVIQPSFFYVTSKSVLMMAAPIDNRKVSPAVMRRVLDKLVKDVEKTKSYWQ